MSMGKKTKKPLSKKTTWLNEQLQRRRGVRELEKRFLVVCEDNKSAPNYFEALKKHFRLSATSIEVVGSAGFTQPVQVVKRAMELKKRAADPDSGTVPYEEVWCVIDGDFGDKITNARSKANARDIQLAVSTMCFEYWMLLHFEETDRSTMDCDGLVQYLKKKHLPHYEKGKCDFHDIVGRVHEACKRAEKLRKPGIKRGDNPEDQNPCSEVYKLIHAVLGA
jgi:hypothetical protein